MEAVNGLGSSAQLAPARESAKTVLSQDEFFRIMITELTNQDPLEPLDNNEFLNQVTQMQTLDTMTRLSQSLEALILGQQLGSAGTLIGRSVTASDAAGNSVEGTVDRVLVQGDEIRLGIGDAVVPLRLVTQVNAAA